MRRSPVDFRRRRRAVARGAPVNCGPARVPHLARDPVRRSRVPDGAARPPTARRRAARSPVPVLDGWTQRRLARSTTRPAVRDSRRTLATGVPSCAGRITLPVAAVVGLPALERVSSATSPHLPTVLPCHVRYRPFMRPSPRRDSAQTRATSSPSINEVRRTDRRRHVPRRGYEVRR